MGGTESTRKISVENNNDVTTVIKVSNKVVDRLKGGKSKDSVEDQDKYEAQKSQVRSNVTNTTVNDNIDNNPSGLPLFYNKPFISSIEMQQEMQKELQKNNEYWETRLNESQKSHRKMNEIMENEYIKTSEEMSKLLPRDAKSGKLPCQEFKADIEKCYKQHTKQSLLCSKEIEAFCGCMTNVRVKLQNENKLS